MNDRRDDDFSGLKKQLIHALRLPPFFSSSSFKMTCVLSLGRERPRRRRRIRINVSGPCSFWVAIHALVTAWLFLNTRCSLNRDAANGKLGYPLVTVALLTLNGVLYVRVVTSPPKTWRRPPATDDELGTMERGDRASTSSADHHEKAAVVTKEKMEEEEEEEEDDEEIDARLLQSQQDGERMSLKDQNFEEEGGEGGGVDVALPLRTKYCKACKAYVLRHDHHCPFLGGCIGLGNHRTFYLFLAIQTGLCAYAADLNSKCFRKVGPSDSGNSWVVENGLPILVMLVILFALLVLVPLFSFHTFLILTNTTTYEMLARDKIWYLQVYPAGVNPFDKGVVENVKTFFREELEDVMPSLEPKRDTIWDNRHYSCCG